jgi:hypothetical protein
VKLLAGTFYDPVGAAVTKATSSLLAMTAFDTTNLRLTFTAPSNGVVLVRSNFQSGGAAASAMFLIGVLDGATVKARQAPISGNQLAAGTVNLGQSCSMLIGGLTPGQSYTWDLAYSVEVVVASSVIRYGGLNNTTANDNWGGIGYEIWDTPGLLAWTHYDPGTASQVVSMTNPIVLTAIDTTNLRLTFTCPSSGKVLVRLRGVITGTTSTIINYQWGILDGGTLRGRCRGMGGRNQIGTVIASDQLTTESQILVTGLTGGTSYTWDAAVGVDAGQTSALVSMGGPDNTTTNDAWGGFAYDIWNVDSLPSMIGAVS